MGMMIDGAIRPRYMAALAAIAAELGCSEGQAIEHLIYTYAKPYLDDEDAKLIGAVKIAAQRTSESVGG